MTIQLAMEHKKLRVKEMRTVKENEGACKVATDKEDIDLKPLNEPIINYKNISTVYEPKLTKHSFCIEKETCSLRYYRT